MSAEHETRRFKTRVATVEAMTWEPEAPEKRDALLAWLTSIKVKFTVPKSGHGQILYIVGVGTLAPGFWVISDMDRNISTQSPGAFAASWEEFPWS